MELALKFHNNIRETHIDTESLALARDLSADAQEYTEHLKLVEILPAEHFCKHIKTNHLK